MKKGWKIFWIICGSAAFLGAALCAAGLALGGSVKEAYYEVRGIPTSSDPEKTKGSGKIYDHTFLGVEELDLDVDFSKIYIKEGEEGKVRVTIKNTAGSSEIFVEQEGSELSIESQAGKRWWMKKHARGERVVTVYVPSSLLSMDLQVRKGHMNCESLKAKEISLEAEASDVKVDSFYADQAQLELAAGKIEAFGDITRELEMDCSVGEILFHADGNKDAYDYEIDCNTGTVELDGEDYRKNNEPEAVIDNQAGVLMKIDCEAGKVDIDYSR